MINNAPVKLFQNTLTGPTSNAGGVSTGGTSAYEYGTQTQPLNSFAVDGRTGNKTTNADLPEWLRKLGMKGDAYAGGMLKPQLRYGFWFKDGKINFADGTSFAAKKTKGTDGKVAYTYTGADGNPAVYSPTDEQNAYNKAYKAATSNNGFFEKVGNMLEFEWDHLGNIFKDFGKNPERIFLGAADPLSSKLWGGITGKDYDPIVNEWGGATEDRFNDYERRHGVGSLGYAREGHQVAQTIAGMYAGAGLQDLAGKGLQALGGNTGSGLGIFSNGGQNGLAGVGVGNAGRLAQSGAITGGAGVAGFGGLSGAANSISGLGGSMGWTDWLNLGGQLLGGYLEGKGAKDASNAQIAAAQAGIAEQRRQFDLNRQDQMPWVQAGTSALGRLQDPTAFTQSPGYNFVRREGNRDIGNSFAARGGALSGNALRGITQYNQNLASQEYNNWFNQQSNLAGLGQTSAQSLGSLGQNSANNVANLLGNQGNARASGIEGQTNAYTNLIGNLLSTWNRGRSGGGSGGGGGGAYGYPGYPGMG